MHTPNPVLGGTLIALGAALMLLSGPPARVSSSANSRLFGRTYGVRPTGFILVGIGGVIVGIAVLVGLA